MKKKDVKWTDKKRTLFGLPLSFTTYTLTSERFFVESGVLTRTEDEVRLYRIMDVSMRRTLGQRIFGVGTIHCCSADKSMNDFDIINVKDPDYVKELLSEAVEKEREDKRVSNREIFSHMSDIDDDDENDNDDDDDR